MSPEETPPQPPSPYSFSSTPPIQPATPVPFAPPPKWPTVIGVIAIIWAAICILGGVCGFAGSTAALNRTTPGGPPMPELTLFMGLSYVLSLLMAAALLAIGIGLLKHRPWSVRLGRIWAVADIVVVFISLMANYSAQQSQFESMSAGGTPMHPAAMKGIMAGSVGCSLIIGCALPIFMLIWFSRQKIKDQVASWAVSTPTL